VVRLVCGRRGFAPVFRRRRYSTGKEAADLRWFTPSGTEMTAENWADPERPQRCVIHRRINRSRCRRGRHADDRQRLSHFDHRVVGAADLYCARRSPWSSLGCRLRHLRSCTESQCHTRAYGPAPVSRDLAVANELSFGLGITWCGHWWAVNTASAIVEQSAELSSAATSRGIT